MGIYFHPLSFGNFKIGRMKNGFLLFTGSIYKVKCKFGFFTEIHDVRFRLKVFYTVAPKLSFTKAAAELFISQPAVTKHIRELEQQLSLALFKRNGNTIAITQQNSKAARNFGEATVKNSIGIKGVGLRYTGCDF